MNVIVLESNHRGHHFVYVRLLLPALAKLASRVVLALAQGAEKTAEYQRQLAPLRGSFELDTSWCPHTGSAMARAWGGLAQLERLARRHRADHILIPDGPHLVPLVGPAAALSQLRAAQHAETEVGWIRCRFAYPPENLQRRLKLSAVVESYRWCPWQRFHTIDVVAYEQIQARRDFLSRKFHLLPDPIEPYEPISRRAARLRLGLPEEGRFVGLAGTMDRRQGVLHLARAVARARLSRTDRLLLAGKFPPELRATMDNEVGALIREGRVVLIDRYLSDEEFMHVLSALDLVVTPYTHDFGPSGVVLRAAQAERPVLASDAAWLGHVVPRFGLGWTCRTGNLPALTEALERALEQSADHRQSEASRRLLAFSSAQNFRDAWTARIRERQGLPPESAHDRWQWVLEAVVRA